MLAEKSACAYIRDTFFPASYIGKEKTVGCRAVRFDNGYTLIVPQYYDFHEGDEVELVPPQRSYIKHDLRLAQILGIIYAYYVNVDGRHLLYLPGYTQTDFDNLLYAMKLVLTKYTDSFEVTYELDTKTVDISDLYSKLQKNGWSIDKVFNIMYMYGVDQAVEFVRPFIPIMLKYNRGYGVELKSPAVRRYFYNLLIRLGLKPSLHDGFVFLSEREYQKLRELQAGINLRFGAPHRLQVVEVKDAGIRTLVEVDAFAVDGIRVEDIERRRKRVRQRVGKEVI